MRKWWIPCESAGLFAADQAVKKYVEENLKTGQERKLLYSVVLRNVHNNGAVLNVLSAYPAVVRWESAAAAGCVTVLQAAAVLRRCGFWKKTGLMFLTAGAWSNTWDRIRRGYVVDYIGIGKGETYFSRITYNLADFFIGIGCIILFLNAVFSRK